jgi:hypothetical protein
MTRATREALLEVQAILHEAGWDAPRKPPAETPEGRLEAIRSAFALLLNSRDIALLLPALGQGVPVAEAGKALGLSAPESEELFRDALGRLCAFTHKVEAQGFATAG